MTQGPGITICDKRKGGNEKLHDKKSGGKRFKETNLISVFTFIKCST